VPRVGELQGNSPHVVHGDALGSSMATTENNNLRTKTRLQIGIQKPKVYTDGTFWYGCFTSTREPQGLDEALHDRNWK
jgi:hypothetical protein